MNKQPPYKIEECVKKHNFLFIRSSIYTEVVANRDCQTERDLQEAKTIADDLYLKEWKKLTGVEV
jgi:hypothetical protein